MTEWFDIGALEEVPARGARVIKTTEGCFAVFRTAEDRVFVLEDRCPHKGGPLSEGIVHGDSVTCPMHNWVISLETGMAQGPDEGAVRTGSARIENGRILVDAVIVARRSAA